MSWDAIVIGSGFGGAITGCRLAEAGYRVLILERGRRWSHEESHADFYPRRLDEPERWIWDDRRPERYHGWLDLRVFPNMSVAQAAGVGGGSLIYANVSVEAPRSAFAPAVGLTPWPREITYDELKPYYDRVAGFMAVRPVPRQQWSARTLLMQEGAEKIGHASRFRPIDLAVRFSDTLAIDPRSGERPKRDANSIRPNEHGVMQGECYHCGNCDIGCDVNARNSLDTNYIPRAEKHGAEVRPLHRVTSIDAVSGGYRVSFERISNGKRHSGDSETARIVILAAGSLGSTELLLRSRDVTRGLPRVSPALGRNWSSNGDFLTPAFYPRREVSPTPWHGPPITSVIDFLDRSQDGQSFWIQDGGFPDLLAQYLEKPGGIGKRVLGTWVLVDAIRHAVQSKSPARQVMPWFAQAVDAGDGTLGLRRRFFFFGRRLHLSWDIAKSKPAIDAVVKMHRRLAESTDGVPHVPLSWSLLKDLVTPHPLGGCGMGDTSASGVVNHAGEVFGHENLYVADAAVFPRAIGVNPSRTIGALAERISKLIVEEAR